MHRWGGSDTHSYLIYAGFSKENATKEGKDEVLQRGGKYEFELTEFTPDDRSSKTTLIDRADNKLS